MNPYVIAEIGSNWKDVNAGHDEKYDLEACEYAVWKCKEAGASAVKFQLFTHYELYGIVGDDTYSLPESFICRIKEFCDQAKIDFMITPFSADGFYKVDPLVNMHKIASSSVSNDSLTGLVMESGKPFLYSSGMVTANFLNTDKAIPLWCASKYPAAIEDYDLNFFAENKHKPMGWGLSDHTLDYHLALFCRANGADYFEKHVNPSMNDTPDSSTSIGLGELNQYIKRIQSVRRDHAIRIKKLAGDRWADKLDPITGTWKRPNPGGE